MLGSFLEQIHNVTSKWYRNSPKNKKWEVHLLFIVYDFKELW
jgi:hypothetical protein